MQLRKIAVILFRISIVFSLISMPTPGMTAADSGLRDIGIANLANISENPELNQMGRSISDTIITHLASSQKLSLVERERLEDAMNEMGLAEVGITDPQTAAKVGKAVGARQMFGGTISEFKSEGVIVVNVRLFDVESAGLISGWSERATTANLSKVAEKIAGRIIGQLFPISPGTAALKSAILPGWGQLSNRRSSGYLFLVGGLASAGGLVATQLSLSSAEDDLDALTKATISSGNAPITASEIRAKQSVAGEAQQDVDDKRTRRNVAAIVLGAVWGLNIIDAYIETNMLVKSRREAVLRTVMFEATPEFEGIVMRVRF